MLVVVTHILAKRSYAMPNKKPRVVTLRAIRKASHLTGNIAAKSSHFMGKVERRTTRLIIESTGSATGHDSVDVDRLYFDRFPHLFPVHPALPNVGQRPSVTVFAFLDPKGFYGGIATLLLVSARLAQELNYDLRIAQTTGYSKDNDVLGFLASNGIVLPKERYSTIDLSRRDANNFAYLPFHPDDVVVVSAWWDAHIAAQLPLKQKFVYLIQDFEPIFYNNSDEYVLADATYRTEKFIPVCNTQLLYEYFKEKNYSYITKHASWFEPAPAPQMKSKLVVPATKEIRKLFLYGRPAVHRNLYMSAVKAIDIAFGDERLRDEKWEIYNAGSDNVTSIRLHSGRLIKSLGKMNLEDYYTWATGIDIAVSPMLAPHPNYPTLELASLGAMVVTTKWETKQDLSRYSRNILMADATAESMAEAILQAALTSPAVRQKNLDTTKINTSWATAFDDVLPKIANTFRS